MLTFNLPASPQGAPDWCMNRMIGWGVVAATVWAISCCIAASASALPGGRVYEMVSPVNKQGHPVRETLAVQPEGDGVVFVSRGGFAGALSGGIFGSHDYLARRDPTEWATGSLEPSVGALSDVSASLQYALASSPLGPNAGVENHSSVEQEFGLHATDVPNTADSWEAFGGAILKRLDGQPLLAGEEGASADLCHVIVGQAEGALSSAAEGTIGQIYDLTRGCDGQSPSLRLVGLDNSQAQTPINRACPVGLGTGQYIQGEASIEQESDVNAVDAGGGEVFFTTNVREGGSCNSEGLAQQLFVRLGGTRTVEVSRPLEPLNPFGGCVASGVPGEVPCDGASTRPNAYFKGASEDGSKVFFTTTAPLTGEGEGNNLYMATIGCPGSQSSQAQSCESSQREVTSLVRASTDTVAKEAAEVQGVVRIAPDGSRVYFVARGLLSEGANAQGQAPVSGADNLYLYDAPAHKTTFVADLCSGASSTGVVADVRCPRELPQGADAELLWHTSFPEAQSTSSGSFLVFASYGRLLSGDTDNAKDIYRYDAQTGALERVSVGEDSYHANGNSAVDADIELGFMGSLQANVYLEREMAKHAISEDGSRIVFHSVEPLSPEATNGHTDIYEWHEGHVALISSGVAELDDINSMITASGGDVFFTSSQGLLPQDTDGLADVYDARIEGGFPPPPPERAPCSADACQGPLTAPAPLLVPGSVSQAPGRAPASASKPKVKAKKKAKAKKKKHRGKRSRKSGKASSATRGSGR